VLITSKIRIDSKKSPFKVGLQKEIKNVLKLGTIRHVANSGRKLLRLSPAT
jgi:hypothetical protein